MKAKLKLRVLPVLRTVPTAGAGIAVDGVTIAADIPYIAAQINTTPDMSDAGYLARFTDSVGTIGQTAALHETSAGLVGIGTASPVNKLDVSGSFGRGAPVTKDADFTLGAAENWVICNKASTTTVTFPAASAFTGREVMLKTIQSQTVVSASSNVVPLAGGSASTAILSGTAGKWATLVSDGTNWIIMQGN